MGTSRDAVRIGGHRGVLRRPQRGAGGTPTRRRFYRRPGCAASPISDFVCQLTVGRVLAVEYKGRHPYGASDAGVNPKSPSNHSRLSGRNLSQAAASCAPLCALATKTFLPEARTAATAGVRSPSAESR